MEHLAPFSILIQAFHYKIKMKQDENIFSQWSRELVFCAWLQPWSCSSHDLKWSLSSASGVVGCSWPSHGEALSGLCCASLEWFVLRKNTPRGHWHQHFYRDVVLPPNWVCGRRCCGRNQYGRCFCKTMLTLFRGLDLTVIGKLPFQDPVGHWGLVNCLVLQALHEQKKQEKGNISKFPFYQ